ncbi:hypothetical protein N5D41_13265 [Pseudomonas toyotomiensis]|uniref:Uncharacterized protein n=1 Tax=Ectopseudomonas toyotomiensis TaxID=554344 RepID=A0AA42LLU3_9GAMM|nr:hypothetical protein [Pseudomonas toyotomiensis]MDH0702450.1 hypothetical protein [Pseudomonas toyotomiensis]
MQQRLQLVLSRHQFGDDEAVLGDAVEGLLVIDFSKEATYKDAGGEVVSSFQRDQTLVRVIAKHDIGPRHVESIVVGTACDWGAGM